MIIESVKFLENFQKDSNINIYDCRTFLARFVEKHLSDFDKVAASLKKHGVSECKVALDFCALFLKRYSGVFITPLPHQTPSTPPLSQMNPAQTSEEEQLTHSFLLWYLSKILALLGHQQCADIHKLTLEMVQKLLVALKNRDCYTYQSVLNELLLCTADLVKVNENLYDKGMESEKLFRFNVPMDKVLKSLQEADKRTEESEVRLSSANFIISSTEVCDLLQFNLTKIILPVIGDISQFCSRQIVNSLWACLACHLEYGNIQLKTESLQVCSAMMNHCEKLPLQVEEYFTDCLLALLEFLCNGITDVDESEVKELEIATADVFTQLLSPSLKFLPSLQITSFKILLKLGSVVQNRGLRELRTVEMRSAIGRLICDIQDVVPLVYLRQTKCDSHWNELMEFLIGEIGSSDSLQVYVGSLVKAIMCELSTANQKAEKDQDADSKEPNRSGTKQSTDLSKRKRKLDEGKSASTGGVKLSRNSLTYKKLIMKLTQLLKESISQETVVTSMEGLRTVLEIIASSVSFYNTCGTGTFNSSVGKNLSDFGTWLSPDYCREINAFLFKVLQAVANSSYSPSMTNDCVRAVLRTVGSLLSIQEFAEFDSEVYQSIGWMSSLPWLLNDPSWIDLKLANAREVVKIAGGITERLDKSSICESLQVLSLLPKEVASKWRVHVFRQALNDSDETVMKKALEVFPILLYHLGPNANHLVYDLIHPTISQESEILQSTLATITGPLACVVSRKAVMNRPEVVSDSDPLYKRLTIGCMSCNSSSCEYKDEKTSDICQSC